MNTAIPGGVVRRLLTTAPLAGAALAASLVTSPSPASAATSVTYCFEFRGVEHCIELPLQYGFDCPLCPPDFAFDVDHAINPAESETVVTELAQGFGDVIASELLGDRGARTTGLAHLDRAASLVGRDVRGVRSELSWVNAAQQDIVDGLLLFQQADATRDPAAAARLQAQGVGQIDQAVDLVSRQITAG